MTVRGEDDSRDPPASWQYASKCLYSTSPKIWFLLMVGHLGLTPLSTQSINERITQRAADTRDPAGRAVVIYFFLRNKQLLFILVLATDHGNNGAERGLWPVQPGFYLCLPHHEPSCVFFLLKMASPVLFFKINTQTRPTCFFSPVGLQIFQDEESFTRFAQKWAIHF